LKSSVLLSVVLFILALACGDPSPEAGSPTEEAPSRGGTAVVAIGADFDVFNELATTAVLVDQVIGHVLFQNLMVYDENLDYAPALADSFWVAADGLSASFRIRDGVRWHDGVPVTVDDVIWSFEMSKLDEVAYPERQTLQYVQQAERVDDRTVRFVFNAVHAEPLADFIFWTPMPKHLLEGVPPIEMINAQFNRQPVGNGPFRFVSWKANEQVVLEANEDFWAGRPYLDRIVFRVIPENATAITELLSGGIDLYGGVSPMDMGRLEESEIARPLSYPSLGFTSLIFNLENPLLADVRVRRALTLATDRQALIEGLLRGYAELTAGPVAPSQWERNAVLEPWPHDPDAAARLLAEAGWRDTDGDEILDKAGRPFRFQMITDTDNLREDVLVALQSQFREIGVNARAQSVEANTLGDKWMSGDFEAILISLELYLRFDATLIFETGAPFNGGSYSNLRVDDLMRRARTTQDRAEAKPLWDEFQAILHEDSPFIFLYFAHARWGASRRLQGVAPAAEPSGYSPLASVTKWWIPTDQR
jgi:peptide/nickel transport system substrate-binding protein